MINKTFEELGIRDLDQAKDACVVVQHNPRIAYHQYNMF